MYSYIVLLEDEYVRNAQIRKDKHDFEMWEDCSYPISLGFVNADDEQEAREKIAEKFNISKDKLIAYRLAFIVK